MLNLELGDINEYFKELKDEQDASGQYKLLPDFETIITEAKRMAVTITDARIEGIMEELGLRYSSPR